MKRLTAKLVESINRPGKFFDSDAGLYLYVQERNGRIRKSYVQRVTVHGKRVEIGLGSTKWTTPSEARAKAQANRKIARTGGDPRQGKATTVPTFEEAADTVIRMHVETWRDGGKTEARWRATLATYAFRRLGRKSVADITAADVLAVLTADEFWQTKRETARKVKQRISTILDWAAAQGHRTDNPCNALKTALPKTGHQTRHQRALPFDRVSDALAVVRASAATPPQSSPSNSSCSQRRAAAKSGAVGGTRSMSRGECGRCRASGRRRAGRTGCHSRAGHSKCSPRRASTRTPRDWSSRALAD